MHLRRRKARASWNPRPMLWNKVRPPTITKRGSTMATVLSKVLRKSSKVSAMCATSKGTVLRTVVVARNKGIRKRDALKPMRLK